MVPRALARCALFTLFLSLAAGSVLLPASAAVPPMPRANITNDPVQIVPAAPCVDDDVRLLFTICTCNAHFLSAHRIDQTHAQLDVAYNPTIVCVQCAPDTLGLSLGTFALGSHVFDADIVAHVIAGPDSGTTHVEHYQVSFDVSDSCQGPTGQVPYLQSVWIGEPQPCEVCPPRVCAGDSIPVFLRGVFTSPCLQLADIRVIPRRVASAYPAPDIVQLVYRDQSSCTGCTAILVPWAGDVRISALPLGSYRLPVEAYVDNTCDGSDSLAFLGAAQFPFTVGEPCAVPPDSLPHIDQIVIGKGSPCASCLPIACWGDSIPIVLRGHFEDDCIELDTVRVAPNPSMSPLPMPDIVQVVYRINGCLKRPCATGDFPWERSVQIEGLPPSLYGLPVEVYLRDVCTTDLPRLIGRASIPFMVDDTCGVPPPPYPCYFASFAHATNTNGCDAIVGPDQPGEATYQVTSTVPIGGIQGRLLFEGQGLRVTHIEAVQAGALLSWAPKEDGATFVYVAGSAPLPQHLPLTTPIFRVRVEVIPGVPLLGLVRLHAIELLVSDVHGITVTECPVRLEQRVYLDPAARFCPEQGCDFNGDLRADVRDLVLMAGCILHPEVPCPPGAAEHLDCDADGDADLDDVLCCARVILGTSAPDSAGAQPAPGVALRFGVPVEVTGGLDVPVAVTEGALLGAMRLSFRYPDRVFESASVEVTSGPSNWLALDQSGGGRIAFGAIRIAPVDVNDLAMVDPVLNLMLHLRTRAGQAVAGALDFVTGEFANPLGAALVTSAVPISTPLAPGARLAISGARPNPFASETRFSVLLAQDADLDLSVYDLLGRRVATLFKGHASAGPREFTWRRTRDDGAAVGSGVYFLRAVSGREAVGQKVLVLSRP